MGRARPPLILYVPGLLAAPPEGVRPPELPFLEKLLARADRGEVAGSGYAPVLGGLFGRSTRERLPVAALALRGEGGMPGEACWLCADPVHLVADRDRLFLTPPGALQLSAAESQQLIVELNGHLQGDGLQLLSLSPERWYLRCASLQLPATATIDEALGQHLDGLLPSGEGAEKWRALLTELQMLLHNSVVNSEREAQGRAAINSLWLWGGGVLPEATPPAFAAVCADEALARGLAYMGSVEPVARPENLRALMPGLRLGEERPVLVVWDKLRQARLAGDNEARLQALAEFEASWAEPLWQELRWKVLSEVRIVTDSGQSWQLKPGSLRRFWRRAGRVWEQ